MAVINQQQDSCVTIKEKFAIYRFQHCPDDARSYGRLRPASYTSRLKYQYNIVRIPGLIAGFGKILGVTVETVPKIGKYQ